MRVSPCLALLPLLALLACESSDAGGDDPDTETDPPSKTYTAMMDDVLIAADIWTNEPEILSAGLGFEGTLGVPNGDTESAVRRAGGTWNDVTCTNGSEPPLWARTSAATPTSMQAVFGYATSLGDGLPVVFSWPVLPSTVQRTDFEVVLNTGEIVRPDAASLMPNYEYNERNTIVLVSPAFCGRVASTEEGAVYPVEVRIVEDDTPMQLVGPDGPVVAVGMSHASSSPYDGVGPFLVGAKLNRASSDGETWPDVMGLGNPMPNDADTLYGSEAQYRLRILTTGGFSPDGVRAVLPTEFARYFRLQVTTDAGETLLVTEAGVDYDVDGASVRVVGLADLGQVAGSGVVYDDCYNEDSDNYIDIMLAGDEAAVRKITAVEIPASGAYDPFYTPGGPGNDPTSRVQYTYPGPPDVEPVTLALDAPMQVSYP